MGQIYCLGCDFLYLHTADYVFNNLGKPMSRHLRYVTVPVITNSDCKLLPGFDQLHGSQICAGNKRLIIL